MENILVTYNDDVLYCRCPASARTSAPACWSAAPRWCSRYTHIYNIYTIYIFSTIHNIYNNNIYIHYLHAALQGVARTSAGQYTCTASNIEGDTTSNSRTLTVKCELVLGNRAVNGTSLNFYNILKRH